MVWLDFTHTLLTILSLSVWPYRTKADLPLYSSDIPESERNHAVKKLEKSLLNILGMKERPRPSAKDVRVSPFMKDLYNKQSDDSDYMAYTFHDGDAYHANTARSYSHIGTKSHTQNRNIVNLYFNVTDISEAEDLLSAKLHLFPHNKNSTQKYRVDIYELISSPHSVEKSITRLIDTQIVRPSKTTPYYSFDITPAAQRWYTSSSGSSNKNKKISAIQVHIKSHEGHHTNTNHLRLRRDITEQDTSEWLNTKPEMVVFTNDKTLSRTKRGSGRKRNRGAKRVKSECQRREMMVNFSEVGWDDWILAPRSYDAYYCRGACQFPLSDHLNATNHAIIQTLVNEMEPGNVPQSCCIPTELSPISMLYLGGDGSGEVTLKTYPDMVVEACGCR